MSKKIISIILSVLMIASMVSVISVSAFAASTDDLVYEVNGGKATIVGCDMTIDGTLVIPETIDGYTVNAIGEYAFAGCVALDEVTIPATVETIGEGAFDSCVSLTSVTVYSKTVDLSSSSIGYSFYDVFDGKTKEFVDAFFVYAELVKGYSGHEWDFEYETKMLMAQAEMLQYAAETPEAPVAIDGMTISGYSGSTAETYAKDNGFKFVSLDKNSGISNILGDMNFDFDMDSVDDFVNDVLMDNAIKVLLTFLQILIMFVTLGN